MSNTTQPVTVENAKAQMDALRGLTVPQIRDEAETRGGSNLRASVNKELSDRTNPMELRKARACGLILARQIHGGGGEALALEVIMDAVHDVQFA